ncbi:MAG: RNA polymerase subunit sigma-24 [Verrucomicrobia bacterium RIFCSPLOWO2_12_FULL_64_8]|nr:MAG: RNA polymerase subunit sigma-24 [Verrucomicrobia bacterium RIFCSPLOWO2_12_FULL_64_8]
MPDRKSTSRQRPLVKNTPDPETQAREAEIDADLTRRFNAGDESAFNEIVSRYHGKIYGLTLSLLHNAADAEEITQDTFIRAYRGLGRFRGDSSLATWLHRIAVNLARNRYWYFFRRYRHAWVSLDRPVSDDTGMALGDLVPAGGHDPSQETAVDEFTRLIAACMERLDQRHREILALRNVQNLPYEEIARLLDINVGTVKSRIARARENLRALLAEICPDFESANSVQDFFLAARGCSTPSALAPA